MRVLIYSSDKTQWSLRPFAYLFNRYWSIETPVKVFGNSPLPFSLPQNFQYESIGEFQPVERWSNDFIEALNRLDDEVICIMLDDYWLSRYVDERAVGWCYEYMRAHPGVARFDLTTDRLYARGVTDYAHLVSLDLIKSDPLSPYHFSLQAALWRRESLLQCLRPNETPWEVEIRGDERLRNSGALVLGTKQAPVSYTIAIQKGHFEPGGGYQTPRHTMNAGDVAYITQQGWLPESVLA